MAVYVNTLDLYYVGRNQISKPQRKYDSQIPLLYTFTEVSPESKIVFSFLLFIMDNAFAPTCFCDEEN